MAVCIINCHTFFIIESPFFPLVGMNIIIPGIYGGNVESILRNLNGVQLEKGGQRGFLDFHLSALGWKDKFDSPRHEWDPYIAITFLRKWQLCWWFTYIKKGDKDSQTRNLATWEAMLDYLYYGRSIDYCRNNHIWRSGVGKDCHRIYINDNLK